MALISKQKMNFAYGMGAAVVIIGALFKITHLEFGFITGNLMLTIGLVVEALIFALSAFEPVDEELDWTLVYPELANGKAYQDKLKQMFLLQMQKDCCLKNWMQCLKTQKLMES